MFGMGEKTETQTSEDKKQAVWGGALADAVASARKKLSGGKKRSSGNDGATEETQTRGGLSSSDEAKIKAMFSPEAWRVMVKTPFTLGKVVTGRKCWELEKEEENTLATTTAASAEYFLKTDPKWLCLTLCMFNWGVVLSGKVLANAAEAAKEKQLENNTTPKPV